MPKDMTAEYGPGPGGRSWQSGIVKRAVEGAVRVGREGLAGDGQADRVHHGGPDKAVLAHASAHYDHWRRELAEVLGGVEGVLPADQFPHGAFGENLTVEGMDEETVCIGDVFRASATDGETGGHGGGGGGALLQVTQPRQPCWILAKRWGVRELPRAVDRMGATGWYLRVSEEGTVEAGMALRLVERPHPEWTLSRAYRAFQQRRDAPEQAAHLAELAELSEAFRQELRA
jgi:MOSC domain-containing protein YiiM